MYLIDTIPRELWNNGTQAARCSTLLLFLELETADRLGVSLTCEVDGRYDRIHSDTM